MRFYQPGTGRPDRGVRPTTRAASAPVAARTRKETTVADLPGSRGHARRAVIGSLALAAVGTPIILRETLANAGTTSTTATPITPKAPQLLWTPDPGSDGLAAFEGIEVDRANKHPDRKNKYIVVEGDHYRFNIWKDDRDSTGGGDRQRTESKGMVAKGSALKMKNNETWTISYDMFMPTSLHGTSKFSHIFQLKTPATNGGPWITLDPSRSGSKETLRARAYSTSGAPDIASTDLAPLRNKWVTIEWTFKIGPKGTARFALRDGSKTVVDHTLSNVNVPDQGDYVRPKWGIYRSIQSASSDILDTYLLIRNYKAYKGT
jgi:hypothetical protein